MKNKIKSFMDKPMTNGDYYKSIGVCAIISLIISLLNFKIVANSFK